MKVVIQLAAYGVLSFPMTALPQTNPWIAIATKIGMEAFCHASFAPGSIPNLKPFSQDQRLGLYLRCEAKGGRDEMIKSSCCEHLTPNDAKNIGVCPDNPVNVVVPVRDAFKAAVKC